MPIYIAGDDVRFNPVMFDAGPGGASVQRIQPVHPAQRQAAIACFCGCKKRPRRCMRVLPAVFPDAAGIGLDVAGVLLVGMEGGSEQLDQSVFVVDELGLHRAHGLHLPLYVAAGNHRPCLRVQVYTALLSLRPTQDGTVVIVATDVPFATPRILNVLLEFHPEGSVRGSARAVPPEPAKGFESAADVDQEPRHPYALSISLDTNLAQAIVPVACANRRQPVPAERHTRVDGTTAVLVDVA